MFIKAKLDDGKELIINIDDVQAMGSGDNGGIFSKSMLHILFKNGNEVDIIQSSIEAAPGDIPAFIDLMRSIK